MKEMEFLQNLTAQSLCYATKSPDTELYEFGFGSIVESCRLDSPTGKIGTYILHVICRFKIIQKTEENQVFRYYEDTPAQKFGSDIQALIGLKVQRVGLSEKNDLWLDFGNYWVVFATFENYEESWRLFVADANAPHLVASGFWLKFL